MKDIFSQYKRHKFLQNFGIIAASLFLAIWVNIQFMNTEISQYLKSNIIETQNQVEKSDIYLEVKDNTIVVKNGKSISEVEQIQFSLIFNNNNINTNNIINNIDNYIINYKYIELWILNIQVLWNWKANLIPHSSLITIEFEKESELKEYINVLNANFRDSTWNTYYLNTSGAQI